MNFDKDELQVIHDALKAYSYKLNKDSYIPSIYWFMSSIDNINRKIGDFLLEEKSKAEVWLAFDCSPETNEVKNVPDF